MSDVDADFADVLAALRAVEPQTPEPDPAARWRAELGRGAPGWETPRGRLFAAHADDVLAYAQALLGSRTEAEAAFVDAYRRLSGDEDAAGVLQAARHVALERLAKSTGTPDPDRLAPAERALVLERRLGVPLRALCRSWSQVPARLEERLLRAGDLLLQQVGGPPACGGGPRLVQAALDLLDDPSAEAHGEHVAACAECAERCEALEDALTLPDTTLADPRATWKQLDTGSDSPGDADALGIRVSVACCYCHDRLRRADAGFCAACLAPHHPDCFTEHGRCATPGCRGDELVLPLQAGREAGRRRPAGPLVAVVLTALAGLAAVGLTSVQRQRSALGTLQRAEVDDVVRPLPREVVLGAPRDALVALFGPPERAVHDDGDDRWRLAWYSQGVKAILTTDGRLLQATFFGHPSADPDGRSDANGNVVASEGPFRLDAWSWRGVRLGARDAAAYPLLAGADAVVADANGTSYASYEADAVTVVVSRDHRVLAFHVGGTTQADPNGNVAVVPDDARLDPPALDLPAGEAIVRATERAALTGLLAPQTYAGYDPTGRLLSVHRVVVEALQEACWQLTVTSEGVDERWRVVQRTRVDWHTGELEEVERVVEGASLESYLGAETTPGRLQVEVTPHDEEAPYMRVVFAGPKGVSPSFATFVLSRLGRSLGERWVARAADPLGELQSGRPFEIEGQPGDWLGRPAHVVRFGRTAVYIDADEGTIVHVKAPPHVLGAEWLEPISDEVARELLRRGGR